MRLGRDISVPFAQSSLLQSILARSAHHATALLAPVLAECTQHRSLRPCARAIDICLVLCLEFWSDCRFSSAFGIGTLLTTETPSTAKACAMRSMRPSRPSRASAPPHCSSAPIRFSPTGESNSPTWRRATRVSRDLPEVGALMSYGTN